MRSGCLLTPVVLVGEALSAGTGGHACVDGAVTANTALATRATGASIKVLRDSIGSGSSDGSAEKGSDKDSGLHGDNCCWEVAGNSCRRLFGL
ncbi:hypothetical protein EDB82DRAFT_510399 [Fusarium venenatum]|uniref:uncharacterized protein n=1 Tax=Fusarium venenatum TaxID=56646 RepID=UPI001E00FA62|nr:hypothetical protein EDB82DRAFT_510399 [Fusarium venenatum]